jgi:hypothetical protein
MYHPKDTVGCPSPWPIIQIYFFDPAPPKDVDYGDVDWESGTQFTCFTSTKVQILTQQEERRG